MNDDVESIEDLDPRVREDVEGLVYLGSLTDSFEFCGHSFSIKTLTIAEEVAAATAIQEFRNTLKEPEAFVTAQIGLSIVDIDGDEDFCPPVGPNLIDFAKARYRWVSKQWYWPTVEFIYTKFVDLQKRQLEAIRSIQDLSTRSLLQFSPSVDSSIDPGNSSEQIDLETQP